MNRHAHDRPAGPGPHPVRGAAAHAALRRGDRRGEVRRPRHGRRGAGARASRATSCCWSRPRSIRWWCTAAGRRSATMLKRLGIKSRIRRRACASPTRRRSRSSRWCWPARSTSRSSATSTRPAARRSGCAARTATWCTARKVTRTRGRSRTRNIEKVVDLGFVGEPDKVDITVLDTDPRPRADPGAGAGRDLGRRRAPTTSTPTRSPAPSPARSRPSACCCSPTCRACSTSRSS